MSTHRETFSDMERGRPGDERRAATRCGRRTALQVAAGALASVFTRESAAQEAMVPPTAQAALLAKVVSYDRNFAARAIDRAKILLVSKAKSPESERVVVAMMNALASLPTVGALPHEEEATQYSDAATVAHTCNSHRISILYCGPGLYDEIPALRNELSSLDILSVGAMADYVPQGIVLGFGLVSGDPKLLLNRAQARTQNVNFGARILRRMTIFQ